MSEIVEAQMAEYFQYGSNPEGFPCCPKCGEFVELTKDMEHYYCGECNHTFPLEEAIE